MVPHPSSAIPIGTFIGRGRHLRGSPVIKKNTCEEREWYSGKGRAACSRTPGRPRAACFGGLFWRPVLPAWFGGLFWRPFLAAFFGASIEISKASPAGAEKRYKNWSGLISSPMVTWWLVLAAFFGGLIGRPVLAARLGGLFWFNETINTNAMHMCETTGTYLRSCSLL